MTWAILCFVLIALIDIPSIIRSKKRALLVLYSALFIAIFIYGVCAILNHDLRSPLYLLGQFMKERGITY